MCTVKIQLVLRVAMELVRFHIGKLVFFFLKTLLIYLFKVNNLDPMRNCPGLRFMVG